MESHKEKDKQEEKKAISESKKDPKREDVMLSQKEFQDLSEKAKTSDECYDKWLRAHAELDNARKRMNKEKEEFLKFANEDLIIRLIPIVDNFDRALVSVKHTDETDAVLKGVKMVQKELHSLFKDHGVEVIESMSKKFDPHLHEAIAVVETDEYPEDTIIEEVQTGYTLKGRLIRPSIVKVSKKKKIEGGR